MADTNALDAVQQLSLSNSPSERTSSPSPLTTHVQYSNPQMSHLFQVLKDRSKGWNWSERWISCTLNAEEYKEVQRVFEEEGFSDKALYEDIFPLP